MSSRECHLWTPLCFKCIQLQNQHRLTKYEPHMNCKMNTLSVHIINNSCLCISGSSPYPGMGGKEVMAQVRRGYRMEKPDHCADEV